jgi:hypothetical protein
MKNKTVFYIYNRVAPNSTSFVVIFGVSLKTFFWTLPGLCDSVRMVFGGCKTEKGR